MNKGLCLLIYNSELYREDGRLSSSAVSGYWKLKSHLAQLLNEENK